MRPVWGGANDPARFNAEQEANESMSDRMFELANHRYPQGHFAFPPVLWEPLPLQCSRPRLGVVTDPVAMTRRCARCLDIKPLDEFPPSAGQFMGRGYGCKACRKAAERERRNNAA